MPFDNVGDLTPGKRIPPGYLENLRGLAERQGNSFAEDLQTGSPGQLFVPDRPWPLIGIITGVCGRIAVASGSPGGSQSVTLYTWSEQRLKPTGEYVGTEGGFGQSPGTQGQARDFRAWPAIEINHRNDVPINKRVLLFPGEGEFWEFEYCCGNPLNFGAASGSCGF